MSSKRPRRESYRSNGNPVAPRSGYLKDPALSRTTPTDTGPIVTSPESDSSGSSHNISNATSRWFGLLASDVSNANYSFATPLLVTRPPLASSADTGEYSTVAIPTPKDTPHSHDPLFKPIPAAYLSTSEPRIWSPPRVKNSEVILMRHFVKHVSTWLDMNDPRKHFCHIVPHLAMHDKGLFKAILALSARDLTIKPKERSPDFQPDRNVAVEYYFETIQYLQQAMKNEAFLRSDELLCTILLISTYELIDGDSEAWRRHLKGAFDVQHSLHINGESGGLKQAVFWSWLRQDLWAAFRERRRIFSYYVPTKSYATMDEWDFAERIIYLCCQCVNYASDEEIEAGKKNVPERLQRGKELAKLLDDWLQHLPPHFQQYPSSEPFDGPFKPIWIHPPAFCKS